MRTRTRILAAALGVAVVVTGLLLVSSASGRKVANPGAISITSQSGNMRVNNESFDFDESSDQITFNGTLNGAGALLIPRNNIVFPDQFTSVDSPIGTYNFRIRITANNDGTGVLNPLDGLTTLNTSLRIDIDSVGSSPPGFGGDCRITPINLALSSAKSQGVPYNTSNGRATVADHGFFVPGAQGCGSTIGINYNDEINSAIGIPTSDTDAVITAVTNPIVQKAVRASFTASPSQGLEPLLVSFNGSGSSVVATPATYRWDFDGNGTFDQTTSGPTTTHTYLTPGTYQAKLRVTDAEGDSDETTREIRVIARTPDMAIDKSHTGDFVAGNQGTYSIAVRNVGTLATTGTVTVNDLLPESLPYVSATGDGWTCNINGRQLTCTNPGPVQPNESLPPISVVVDVTGDAVPQVANTASVATAGDSVSSNNSDTDTATVIRPEPDVAIDKTHEGEHFLRGRRGTWVLEVRNAGAQPTSEPITVTDQLPAGTSFVSAFGSGWTCGQAGGTVTCTAPGPLAAGEELAPIHIRVDVAANAADPIANTATVSTQGDANAGNDSDTDTVPVRDVGVDLTVDKSHTGVFEVTETETYRLVARNAGTVGTAGPIVVRDTLPEGLTYSSASGADWNCSASGQEVTCVRANSLQAGQSAPAITLLVAVGPEAEGGVVNVAEVSGPEPDLDEANNVDEDPTDVRKLENDVAIDKFHTGTFTAGQFATYSLKVSNLSADRTVGPVTVTDELPAELAFDSASGQGWSCSASGQTVTCVRQALLSGNSQAPSITLRVTPKRGAVPSVANTASVSAANDRESSNNTDTDTAQVRFPPANTTTVTRVYGSATYPGRNGGDATFSINVTRSLLGVYSGTVSFNDPGANHRVTAQVGAFDQVSRYGLNGAQGTARISDGQVIRWRVDDLSVLNLGPDDAGVTTPSGYNVTATTKAGDLTVLPRN